jgi:hypothetical protein
MLCRTLPIALTIMFVFVDMLGEELAEQERSDRAGPQAHIDKASMVSAMYFLGDTSGLDSVTRPTRGSIDPSDTVVAIRDNVHLPAIGEVVDVWYSLSSTVGSQPANGLAAPQTTSEPKIRVVMQWVPLFAARSCLRSSRMLLNLNGLCVSVIDTKQELLTASLLGIRCDYSRFNDARVELDGSVHVFQMDNQVPNTQFPVVLCASPVKASPASKKRAGTCATCMPVFMSTC